MAAVISISKAVELLDMAGKSRVSLLWIEGNAIVLGSAPDQIELRLDLVSETLVSDRVGRIRGLVGGSHRRVNDSSGRMNDSPGRLTDGSHGPVADGSDGRVDDGRGRVEDSPWGADDRQWARQAATGGIDARTFALSSGERRTGYYSVTIDGVRHDATSQKSLLLLALTVIESARPGTLEKLSRDKGRTKRIVASNRDDLHANPMQGKKFGVRLNDEWWVTTNNSFAETQRFIRRAAWYAGLAVDIRPAA